MDRRKFVKIIEDVQDDVRSVQFKKMMSVIMMGILPINFMMLIRINKKNIFLFFVIMGLTFILLPFLLFRIPKNKKYLSPYHLERYESRKRINDILDTYYDKTKSGATQNNAFLYGFSEDEARETIEFLIEACRYKIKE